MIFVDCLPEYSFSKDMYVEIDTDMLLSSILDVLSAFFALDRDPPTNSNIASVLGIIGTALLTILIPIAVTAFKGHKGDYETLDLNVILDNVIGGRCFLLYLLLIYAPVFLLGIFPFSSLYLHGLLLGFWFWGVCGMVIVLKKSYRWMKGDKDKLRKEYLEDLNASEKLEDASKLWRSVWGVEGRHDPHEKEFFVIFSSAIDKLLWNNANNVKNASELVLDFIKHINKRSITFLIDLLPKILEWHFLVWKRIYENKDSGDISTLYWYLEQRLSSILEYAQEQAWKEEEEFHLFRKFKSHIEGPKVTSSEKECGKAYIKNVMPYFFNMLLINAGKGKDIGYFPYQWKITIQNMDECDNGILEVLFKAFHSWAEHRISYKTKTKLDMALNNVIRLIFPKSCPIMWAEILSFLMRSYENDNEKMKSIVERPIGFGRVRLESVKAEDKETIDLALHFYGKDLTEESLKKYIADLDKMKDNYADDSGEEIRRNRYKDIFQWINARREELRNSANQ